MADLEAARTALMQNILERYPDYHRFTVNDIRRLQDFDLRGILGVFSHKSVNPQGMIPQSFISQYGEAAAAELVIAIQDEATRRGKPELYATGTLSGGLSNEARRLPGFKYEGSMNSDVPASVTLADNTVRHSTAPKILNYQVAQSALELMASNEAARRKSAYTPQTQFSVTVPQSAVAAVVSANKNLPPSFANLGFSFTARDELAFLSGYATRAGASRDIGPITMEYPPSAVCPAHEKASEILNPSKPDIDAALAWAAGYIVRDVKEMPLAQRSVAVAACSDSIKRSASR